MDQNGVVKPRPVVLERCRPLRLPRPRIPSNRSPNKPTQLHHIAIRRRHRYPVALHFSGSVCRSRVQPQHRCFPRHPTRAAHLSQYRQPQHLRCSRRTRCTSSTRQQEQLSLNSDMIWSQTKKTSQSRTCSLHLCKVSQTSRLRIQHLLEWHSHIRSASQSLWESEQRPQASIR